jgi:outer membrane receptor for ferrienterochelin and colicin
MKIMSKIVSEDDVVKKLYLIILFILIFVSSTFLSIYANEKERGLEDLLFEDIPLVTSSLFFETPIVQAPGYTFIIDKNKIDNSPARTLGQLLAMYVPGIHIASHERHGPIYASRGILIDNNAKTRVMLDGQNINLRTHFGYTAGHRLPLIGDLRYIEIINGPSAIVHGSGAINGLINFIPKNGFDNPGLFLNAEYGFKEKLYKIESGYGLSYGDNKNIFFYGGLVTAEGFRFNQDFGYFETTDRNGYHEKRKKTKVWGFPKPSFKLATYWNHEKLDINLFFQQVNIHQNSFKPKTDQGSFWHQSILSFRPQYTFQLNKKEFIQITGAVEFYDFGMKASDPEVTSLGTDLTIGGSESHVEGKFLYKTNRFSKHFFAIGGVLGKRYFTSQKHFFASDPERNSGIDTEWEELDVFAEDILRLNTKCTISIGTRFNQIFYETIYKPGYTAIKPEDKSHFTSRISSSYKISPKTILRFSYQEGFRYPDAAYFKDWQKWSNLLIKAGFSSMPEIRPETMNSYEFNLNKAIEKLKLSIDVNFYYNTYKDLLHWHNYEDGDGFFKIEGLVDSVESKYDTNFGTFVNALDVFSSIGGEFIINYKPNLQTRIELAYAHSRPHGISEQTYKSLSLVNNDKTSWGLYPPHQIKGCLESSLFNKKLNFNFNLLYNSPVESVQPVIPDTNIFNNPRFVVSFSVGYKLNKNITIQMIGTNIFKNRVPPIYNHPENPWNGTLGTDERLLYVTLKWRI